MLIEDFRDRCSAKSQVRTLLKTRTYEWQFELLVYHLMLRLIRTSKDKGAWIAHKRTCSLLVQHSNVAPILKLIFSKHFFDKILEF